MHTYLNISNLKAIAKEKLTGKYGQAVLLVLVQTMFSFGIAAIFTILFSMFETFPEFFGTMLPAWLLFLLDETATFLTVFCLGLLRPGMTLFFLNLATGRTAALSNLHYGITWEPKKTVRLSLLFTCIEMVCTLPQALLLSSLVKMVPLERLLYAQPVDFLCTLLYTLVTLPLSLVYFLMLDFPQAEVKELLKRSISLMKGHKMRMLLLELSFIPLMLLGTLSFGIGMLWILPYMHVAEAVFFLNLMNPVPDKTTDNESISEMDTLC